MTATYVSGNAGPGPDDAVEPLARLGFDADYDCLAVRARRDGEQIVVAIALAPAREPVKRRFMLGIRPHGLKAADVGVTKRSHNLRGDPGRRDPGPSLGLFLGAVAVDPLLAATGRRRVGEPVVQGPDRLAVPADDEEIGRHLRAHYAATAALAISLRLRPAPSRHSLRPSAVRPISTAAAVEGAENS